MHYSGNMSLGAARHKCLIMRVCWVLNTQKVSWISIVEHPCVK